MKKISLTIISVLLIITACKAQFKRGVYNTVVHINDTFDVPVSTNSTIFISDSNYQVVTDTSGSIGRTLVNTRHHKIKGGYTDCDTLKTSVITPQICGDSLYFKRHTIIDDLLVPYFLTVASSPIYYDLPYRDTLTTNYNHRRIKYKSSQFIRVGDAAHADTATYSTHIGSPGHCIPIAYIHAISSCSPLLINGNIEIDSILLIKGHNAFQYQYVKNNNFIGELAGYNNTGSYVTANGFASAIRNTGDQINSIGNAAASENTGTDINAIGNNSVSNNIGDYINGIGTNAAGTNSGDYVNALGYQAANVNAGNNVNAVGQYAAYLNTGNYVNAIGSLAGIGNSGSNVLALGDSAGYYNTLSDALFITKGDSLNSLIYGRYGNNKRLRFNSQVTITDTLKIIGVKNKGLKIYSDSSNKPGLGIYTDYIKTIEDSTELRIKNDSGDVFINGRNSYISLSQGSITLSPQNGAVYTAIIGANSNCVNRIYADTLTSCTDTLVINSKIKGTILDTGVVKTTGTQNIYSGKIFKKSIKTSGLLSLIGGRTGIINDSTSVDIIVFNNINPSEVALDSNATSLNGKTLNINTETLTISNTYQGADTTRIPIIRILKETLTAGQIHTAATTPITVNLPSSGSGYYWRVSAFDCKLSYGTTPFSSLYLFIGSSTGGTGTGQFINQINNSTSNNFLNGSPNFVQTTNVIADNDTLIISADTDSVFGDSFIDCYITVEKVKL